MQDLYNLHISMLGAQGTGKSSLLASMFYTFKKTAGESGFIMKPATTEDERQLSNSHEEMLRHLRGGVEGDPIGLPPNANAKEYALNLGFLKNNIKNYWLKLHFWDFPGGWILDNRHEVVEHLNQSDVILIAIDTPSLVVSDIYGGWQLHHHIKNRPKEIEAILGDVDFKLPKLILFVPIKCETWRSSTKGSELIVEQVRKGYDGLIANLKMYSTVTIAIIPVQTLGNYFWATRDEKKNNKGKTVIQDKFLPQNTDNSGNAEYCPKDIDQPLIYMLSFLTKQVRDYLNDKLKNKPWYEKFRDLVTGRRKAFFEKIAQLEQPLNNLNKKRMDQKKDGFEIIQGKENFL